VTPHEGFVLRRILGDIVTEHISASIEQAVVVSAFRDGVGVTAIARRTGRSRVAVEWVLKKSGLKINDHKRAAESEHGGAVPADPTRSWRKQDLAFQRAMTRAAVRGLERPPMIGVFKDARPLDAPRLFQPVPHTSGCTSPARECAEVAGPAD